MVDGDNVVTVQPGRGGGGRRLEYKSEYKKSFRPFSNYEYYVGDRFVLARRGRKCGQREKRWHQT